MFGNPTNSLEIDGIKEELQDNAVLRFKVCQQKKTRGNS
jgi:hypothetical protein